MKSRLIFLIAAVLLLFTAQYAEANQSTTESLYSEEDSVVVLDANNIKSNIYKSPKSWLVEFYAHWCGHCQKFAPIYNEFARTVHNSYKNNLVQIAAIDCADKINSDTCRKFEVSNYPTLKFFRKNTAPNSLGFESRRGQDIPQLHTILDNLLVNVAGEAHVYPTFFEGNNAPTTPNNNLVTMRIPEIIQRFGDVVFQADLEKAIHFSLMQEIALHNIIDGDKILALKNFLNLLLRYLPWRGTGSKFMYNLYDQLEKKENITGEAFQNLVFDLKHELNPAFAKTKDWVACKGRGREYPCSLWTLFHTLTVNLKENPIINTNSSALQTNKVLSGMFWYIKKFFGCSECSKHFEKVALENGITYITNKDDGILWLWRVHNMVNERLMSEGTLNAKIQYPAKTDCPLCRDENNNWIKSEVLKYLKKKYTYRSINMYGTAN